MLFLFWFRFLCVFINMEHGVFKCSGFNFCVCSLIWTMVCSDGQEVSQLCLDIDDACKKIFMPTNGQIAVLDWRTWKRIKTIPQTNPQKETWKLDAMLALAKTNSIFSLWKKNSNEKKVSQCCYCSITSFSADTSKLSPLQNDSFSKCVIWGTG